MSTFADKVKSVSIDRENREIVLSLGAFRSLSIFKIDTEPGGDSKLKFDITSCGIWNINVKRLLDDDKEGVMQYVYALIQSAFGEPVTRLSL